MTKNRNLWSLALLAALASPAAAADRPDFTGTWRMDPARSRFGRMPRPESMTLRVEHRDPQLEQTTVIAGPAGEQTTRLLFHTDGLDIVNTFQGIKVRSRARWEGPALVLESRPPYEGKERVFWNRWRVSADRSLLTMEVKIVGEPDAEAQEIVFVRE